MSGPDSFGPFTLDRAHQQVTRGRQPIPVGHRGYLVLEALLDADGAAVSRNALLEAAWPGMIVEEGNLSVVISGLRKQLGDDAGAMIVTVPRIGYRLIASSAQPQRTDGDRGGPPLVAVLPFANHGSNADDAYFADGVVDDIITALSRFRGFAVVSRGASFALRDKGADALSAAARLGVRYALEGSIRRSGERLRLTAQLLDAASGAQLWGERYDGVLADVFAFQDQITESVVGVVEPTIRRAEIERARRKPAANLDAYDLFLQARLIVDGPGADRDIEALALLDRSAELDPAFALARTYAACVYEKRLSQRAPPLSDDDAGAAIGLARQGLSLGSSDPLVRALCG